MLAQLAGYYSQGAEAVPETLLLDLPELSGVAVDAAYSLRKLRAAYSGSAIRVRRSSDNAEQDIGFVGNALDTTALLAFCGAGDGFITTAYAQIGSLNLTQATTTLQPRIVNAGVVEVSGGHPSMRHLLSPSESMLSMDGVSWTARPANGYEFFVMRQDAARNSFILSNTDSTGVFSGVVDSGGTSTLLASNSGTPAYYKNGALVATNNVDTRDDLWVALAIDATLIVRTAAVNFLLFSTWRFFRTDYPTGFAPIEHQFERIIIDGDTIDAAGIAAIEQNQAAHYGITL